tara:strand:+ start:3403 stop:3774 length:372 start_codon:yes stop_codon:yes gene_type:complete
MIKNLIVLSLILLLVDSIFLYFIGSPFKNMIKNIQGTPIKIKLFPAIICYIILIFSLYYFIINKKSSYLDAFFLGFIIYGVYETTNMATINKWNYNIGVIDLIWGGFLFLITTYLYKKITIYI